MKLQNHRHHLGCSECAEAKKERESLRRHGLSWSTVGGLQLHRRQLRRLGMTLKQVERAMKTIHPPLMENLKLAADGRIVVADPRLRWERRLGWDRKRDVLRRERTRYDQWHRGWRAMLRKARREGAKNNPHSLVERRRGRV